MTTLLLFLIPPAAGAIIGFVTNAIAIKMLFRPLREIRILKCFGKRGIKLPFTPGILPRQRERLALSIGGMVERELLTAEILRQRLARDDFREKVRQMICRLTENILEKTPAELLGNSEQTNGEHSIKAADILTNKISGVIEKLYPAFSSAIMKFINREDIRIELESRGRVLLTNIFLKMNTFQRFFLSAAQYDLTLQEKMPEIIEELAENVEKLFQDEKTKKTLINAASASFSAIFDNQDKKICSLLDINENNKKDLDNYIFNKLIDAADGQIENFLALINVKTLVSERIDSLDMLRVERIILDVMADQFKWINVFGGILGFLIGAFQVVFTHFLR